MNWAGLRIAIVGPLPPPAGGMAGQTAQLAELLRGEGATVRLVQTNPPYWPKWTSRFRGLRALVRLVGYIRRLWVAAGEVQIFHLMANSGWSWHLFSTPAIWIGRLRGVKVIVNYRGGEAESFLRRSACWVRTSLGVAAALVVPSGFLEQVFRRYGFAAQVVPNIVDLSRFHPSGAESPRLPGEPIILVARNLEPIYDIGTALHAFAEVVQQYPAARLVVAGSGPEESSLKKLACNLGLSDRVEFAGRLDREAMALRYRSASIMVNPSRVDNMPNSVLEALASGVPVVSTNVGGVPFIVEHERTALLVPPASPGALAEAVMRILTNPGLAQRLRMAGQTDVERYSWPRVRGTLGAVYQSMLAVDAVFEHTA